MGVGLLCPKCSDSRSSVSETRISREGKSLRRRRTCYGCGHRWSTEEREVRPGHAKGHGVNFTINLRIDEDRIVVTGVAKDAEASDLKD